MQHPPITTSLIGKKLTSQLDVILKSLEKEHSPEVQLVKRLEDVISRIGDSRTTKEKRDTHRPIKFKDAFGRKFSFPYHRCKTWEGMEELIKQAFLHVEGLGTHVNDGHYDVMNPAGEVILPDLWEDHVIPGWSLTMSMWPIASHPKVGPPGSPPPPPPRPPAVHVIVDRLPPAVSYFHRPPKGRPGPYKPKRRYDSDDESVKGKEKGIKGLWGRIRRCFGSKKKETDYDTDSTTSLVDD